MPEILTIDVENLIHRRGIESARVEFKASWNTKFTSYQILATICAFANDFQRLGGGYIIIGVEESGGQAVRPIKGIRPSELQEAERWIRGNCIRYLRGHIPLLSPQKIDDRTVLVVWSKASENGPHKAPKAKDGPQKYWIRIGSENVDAQAAGQLNTLMERSTRMPWDNQVAHDSQLQDLDDTLVRQHLNDMPGKRSKLCDIPDAIEIFRKLQIIARVNGHDLPRNVGLLFFSSEPERWFPSARIVVVQFPTNRAGKVLDRHEFKGPITAQLRGCLRYLEGLSRTHIKKENDRSQVGGWVSYPNLALREALVNAVFHRGYRPENLEPTKVWLYPDRMEIISYPGPVSGVEKDHLLPDARTPPSPAPARNPRIGEFLRQRELAEDLRTGLPSIYESMADNGSPVPQFDFDEDRQWFKVTLPAHPEYAAVSALQDAAYLRTVSGFDDAFNRVRDAWEANEASAVLASEMIRLSAEREDLKTAEDVFLRFQRNGPKSLLGNVSNRWIEVLFRNGRIDDAKRILDTIPENAAAQDAVDSAILARRLGESRIAHRYFERAGNSINSDVRALLEFAQTKMRLAQDARIKKKNNWNRVNRRLLIEARELLDRVVQMHASDTRHAWAWYELGRVLDWLHAPSSDVEHAFGNAIRLDPDERRFSAALERYNERRKANANRARSANGRSTARNR